MPEGEIDYPVAGWLFGEPIPNLDELPSERWREVLGPLSGRTRTWAMRRVANIDRRIAAMELAAELEKHDQQRADALRRAAARSSPLPAPRTDREGLRQVNLKLRPDQVEDLRRLAATLSLKPTQLARMLVVNGVRRMLYEERGLTAKP